MNYTCAKLKIYSKSFKYAGLLKLENQEFEKISLNNTKVESVFGNENEIIVSKRKNKNTLEYFVLNL